MKVTDFSVLTLNIHKGFSMSRRRFTLENIRNCLRESDANIVFLQEVVGEHSVHEKKIVGWPQSSQLEYLADSVWTHHAYGKNAIYQNGHHGNAILSEMPFKHFHNLDVSMLNFSQRGILHGITINNLHLLCVHLGLFDSERRAQIKKLIEYVRKNIPENAPLIIAGDFNDWRKNCHKILVRELHVHDAYQKFNSLVAKTFPAIRPMLSMDRIYLRGFQVKSCNIMSNAKWRKISDHCALQASLKIHV
jgi:endonuclease/exonuclease/phosphatase family metal-dependent hydrolase